MPVLLALLPVVALSFIAYARWRYVNRAMPPDPTDDACVACGADQWRAVAPDARRCTSCGYESGPGWLALRAGRGFELGDVLLRLAEEPICDELLSVGSIAEIALDTVFAANE
jgi:hypothetical protein